jgi:predicted transcriptional regulator
MKTITVKADNEFDALLNQLTSRLHTTRSNVIRNAVKNYLKQLDKEALRQQIQSASLKTRKQAIQTSADLEAADNDGLNKGMNDGRGNGL